MFHLPGERAGLSQSNLAEQLDVNVATGNLHTGRAVVRPVAHWPRFGICFEGQCLRCAEQFLHSVLETIIVQNIPHILGL